MFEPTEDDAPGIQYNITRPLGSNDGSLEHVDRQANQVFNFTQEDIDSNRIIFRPPDRELGGIEKDVFLYFTGRLV